MAASLGTDVLVVDDEPAVLALLSQFIPRCGFRVKTAPDAASAAAIIATDQFTCALVDKNLPDRAGLELVAELRRVQPYCACLVMTAYPSYQSILEAMRLGAVDYLEKPFTDLHIVGQKVERAIKQQQLVFERDAFAETLRNLRSELSQVKAQQSDRELLADLIERRVEERTKELKEKVGRLEAELREARARR